MGIAECKEFWQSDEKGASHSLRDACRRCGRTEEAHKRFDRQIYPPDYLANEWMKKKGYLNRPYTELLKNLLTEYIKDLIEEKIL